MFPPERVMVSVADCGATVCKLRPLALLGEPVGSTALAYGLLHEVPTSLKLAGAALILAGIAVAALSAPPTPEPETRPPARR